MNIVVLILAIGAGVTFLASAIQGLVAWHSADVQLQRKLRLSIIVCILLTIVLVGASYYSVQNSDTPNGAASNSASAHSSGSPSSIPGATGTLAGHAPPAGATVTAPASTAYSASQPGPRCDTGAGVWTPQDIGNITCGTQITINSAGTLGYMYFQLPNNAAFSSNNEISIAGGPLLNGNFFGYNCLGLAEQDTNTGILGEYCGNGNWSINVISSAGAIIKTLASGLTSTRASEQLSLIVNGTTVSFSIDNEVHKINISSIQPAKVAIMFSQGMRPENISVQNFSYLAPAS